MERKIGEIFEYNGEWYQCIKNDSCLCDYYDFGELGDCHNIACTSGERKDGKEVIFKKLEKVGEIYAENGRLLQKYKVHKPVVGINEHELNTIIAIEIKQNKENMKEYRMHDAKEDIPEFDKVIDECLFGEDKLNLKPFSLEAAKAGKPVCTRDGRKARIICFDRDWDMHIVALVSDPLGESVHYYLSNGKVDFYKQNDEDLMMLPEKKEGWVNVYRDCDGVNITKDDNIYSSKDAAISSAQIIDRDNYVATTIINWEE